MLSVMLPRNVGWMYTYMCRVFEIFSAHSLPEGVVEHMYVRNDLWTSIWTSVFPFIVFDSTFSRPGTSA